MSSFFISIIAANARSRAGVSLLVIHSADAGRDDLPGEAEAVLQPAARAVLAALGQRVPVAIDLVLVLAHHLQRERLVEA